MEKFIFLLTMISHLNMANGISMPQKSSTPALTVIPSSNSIQVSWEKLTSWSSSSIFMVSISIPDSVIHQEFVCEGGPGTKCVLDTEDFGNLLPSCTSVAITIEASGVVAGPQITTTVSPDPLQLSVGTNERNLFINWELPKSCEKSSKLIIRSQDVIVHEEVFSVPESRHTYELSDDITACDILEVLVKTVNSEGESRGIKNTFCYAEPKELTVNRINSSTLDVIWEYPSCILKTEISLYDTSHSSSHLIGRDEVTGTSTLITTENEQNLTICVKPIGRFGTQCLEGEETCVDIAEILGPPPPHLTLKPHLTSVDVTFIHLAPWSSVTEFTLTIHKGTGNTGNKLCSKPFTCNVEVKVCKISSDTFCDPLPSCADVFVEVLGNNEVSSGSTKTLCDTTSTTSTMSTTETTSASKTSTESSTVTAQTTTIITTSPTSTTPITTKSTSTTTTITPEVPVLTLTPYTTSVDVTFFRLTPWNTVTDYTLTIHKGTDSNGDELCSKPFTCEKQICKISSDTYCDPLPACTDVFVEVLGYDEGPMSDSIKTLCDTTPTTATMSTAETTSVTHTVFTDSTTDPGNTTPKPKDNTALIVGLSVGIPVSLIVIAGVAYIIKAKFFGKTVVEMASYKL